jgi:hypothetical protein
MDARGLWLALRVDEIYKMGFLSGITVILPGTKSKLRPAQLGVWGGAPA